MPLHDWTDDRGWDSVHPLWLTYLLEHVQERLPDGYRAFLGGVPVLNVEPVNGKPDVNVRQWGSRKPVDGATASTGLLEPDAEAHGVFRLDPQRAVHVESHGRLIAALELVSPRNKDRADSKETYTNRYLGYLKLGVHMMLVDVLPRPKKFSFFDTISSELELTRDMPALPAPFAAVFRVNGPIPVNDDIGSSFSLWRRELKVGQPLPTLPLPLSIHDAVTIDLEETYSRAAKRAYLE